MISISSFTFVITLGRILVGLDCRIYAVPKHESNPSVFLEYFEVLNVDNTGKEYVSFYKEVAYWRKNWFIFNFFCTKSGETDFNGYFLLISEKDIDELMDALRDISKEEYDNINRNEFNDINYDISILYSIKSLMKKYDGVLQFYFEGDY